MSGVATLHSIKVNQLFDISEALPTLLRRGGERLRIVEAGDAYIENNHFDLVWPVNMHGHPEQADR